MGIYLGYRNSVESCACRVLHSTSPDSSPATNAVFSAPWPPARGTDYPSSRPQLIYLLDQPLPPALDLETQTSETYFAERIVTSDISTRGRRSLSRNRRQQIRLFKIYRKLKISATSTLFTSVIFAVVRALFVDFISDLESRVLGCLPWLVISSIVFGIQIRMSHSPIVAFCTRPTDAAPCMMLRISICRVGFWLSARLHGPLKPGTYPFLR